jgi:O-methyltransferase
MNIIVYNKKLHLLMSIAKDVKDVKSIEYCRLRYTDDINENIKPLLIDLYDAKRYQAFLDGVEFVEYEYVPGDFLEFGVASGVTLLFIALAYQRYKSVKYASDVERKLFGFDSFEGLPENEHRRWPKSIFKSNVVSSHPTLAIDELVTEDKIHAMFDKCELPRPVLIKGNFSDTIDHAREDGHIHAAALVHIDCDLYESCRDVLKGIRSLLQNGTVIYFDDWNNYKGDPNKGERRAVTEFLAENPNIIFNDFLSYTAFSKAFIVHIK